MKFLQVNSIGWISILVLAWRESHSAHTEPDLLGKVCEREEDSIHFHFYDPPSSIRYWIAESRPNKGPESVPTSIKKWNKGKTCSKLELKPGNGLMSFSSQLRVPSSKIPAAALTTSACSFRCSFPCFYYRFHGTLYYIISYTKAFSLP